MLDIRLSLSLVEIMTATRLVAILMILFWIVHWLVFSVLLLLKIFLKTKWKVKMVEIHIKSKKCGAPIFDFRTFDTFEEHELTQNTERNTKIVYRYISGLDTALSSFLGVSFISFSLIQIYWFLCKSSGFIIPYHT